MGITWNGVFQLIAAQNDEHECDWGMLFVTSYGCVFGKMCMPSGFE